MSAYDIDGSTIKAEHAEGILDGVTAIIVTSLLRRPDISGVSVQNKSERAGAEAREIIATRDCAGGRLPNSWGAQHSDVVFECGLKLSGDGALSIRVGGDIYLVQDGLHPGYCRIKTPEFNGVLMRVREAVIGGKK